MFHARQATASRGRACLVARRAAGMHATMTTGPPAEAMGAFAREQAELTGPSDEARAAQLQLGLDLASVNAGGTGTLPTPATVILDASRTIRWIDVHPWLQHPHRAPTGHQRPRPPRALISSPGTALTAVASG